MWAALTAIATALTEWLRLKQVSAAYDLRRRIETDIAADEATLRRLRALPDTDSQLAADRLRDRILRAQGIAANLPAAGADPAGGGASANG